MLNNTEIINMAKEITIAKVSASDISANRANGAAAADFMQQIYNKLVELNNSSDKK